MRRGIFGVAGVLWEEGRWFEGTCAGCVMGLSE